VVCFARLAIVLGLTAGCGRLAFDRGAAPSGDGGVPDTNATVDTSGAIDAFVDADGDGVAAPLDCDDANPLVFPGRAERCNALDDDCDSMIEPMCPTGCVGVRDGTRGYMFCATGITWLQARTACESALLRVVRVDTAAENTWLRDEASARGFAEVWLGGSDAAQEGAWVWADGVQFWQGDGMGSAIGGSYTRWAPPLNGGTTPQPDNFGGAEDFIELLDTGEWNDNDGPNQHPYICEDWL
jgi:hypothetical protein